LSCTRIAHHMHPDVVKPSIRIGCAFFYGGLPANRLLSQAFLKTRWQNMKECKSLYALCVKGCCSVDMGVCQPWHTPTCLNSFFKPVAHFNIQQHQGPPHTHLAKSSSPLLFIHTHTWLQLHSSGTCHASRPAGCVIILRLGAPALR